jgi:hypothetical protein
MVHEHEEQEIIEWFGKYGQSWQGAAVDEATVHPAKFSRLLIKAIYEHMLERGYIKPGDTVLDPFAGTGLGAYHALRNGLNWVGMELEQFFVDIGAGCDCPGFSKKEWRRWYGRAGRQSGLCPRCQWVLKQPPDRETPPLPAHRQARQARMKEIALKHKRPLRFVQPLPLPGTSAYRQTAGKPRMMALFEVAKPPTGHVEQNSGQTPHMPPHRYQGNLEKWKGLGLKGTAVLLQGDSRYLLKVLGKAQAANISPKRPPFDNYGRSPGQLGSMPSGEHLQPPI